MKILLIGINSALLTPMVDEMRRQGHEVTCLENGEISRYSYLHPIERITNHIAKSIFKRNLKRERSVLSSTQFLDGFLREKYFDLTILTNPDIYSAEHLAMLRKCSNKLVCHLWDSISRIPGNLKHINEFDRVMSFDPNDINKYGFTEVTNYFPLTLQPLPSDRTLQGDLFGIFTYDRERYSFISQMLDANPQLNTKVIMLANHPRKIKAIKDHRFEVITAPILGDELTRISSSYKAVLDIGYIDQKGLSFRFFEAIAQNQKLVTNNDTVRNYPFYHADNIYCLNKNELKIHNEFFRTPYKTIPNEVKNSYRIDAWVEQLLIKMML